MDNPQATDGELGWLAGIIDGDGWVGVCVETEHWYRTGHNTRQKSIRTEVRITNTDMGIIDHAAEIMRKIGINPYIRQQGKTKNGTKVYDVSTKRMKSVAILLRPLVSHLAGTKRERAQLVLDFIESRKANPGVPNPAYANAGEEPGRKGPRTIRPYNEEELDIVERCIDLQTRKGASETTREARKRDLQKMRRKYHQLSEVI
uniref:Putative homing endonuclease n=1 Tax=viral metagenome TaxID=1070528 RepID=A0A6M3J672_9ZZZZ